MNTTNIIVVQQDSRPSKFEQSFRAKNGVQVDMTFKTRDEVTFRQMTTELVETMGLTPVEKNKPMGWTGLVFGPPVVAFLWLAALAVAACILSAIFHVGGFIGYDQSIALMSKAVRASVLAFPGATLVWYFIFFIEWQSEKKDRGSEG
jgi:hypothetical protein